MLKNSQGGGEKYWDAALLRHSKTCFQVLPVQSEGRASGLYATPLAVHQGKNNIALQSRLSPLPSLIKKSVPIRKRSSASLKTVKLILD